MYEPEIGLELPEPILVNDNLGILFPEVVFIEVIDWYNGIDPAGSKNEIETIKTGMTTRILELKSML